MSSSAQASPARSSALAIFSECRRAQARVRDYVRTDARLEQLSTADKALAFRLLMGASAARAFLEQELKTFITKASSLEPRVLDALVLSSFELCYLETPAAVAVNEGVELVRSVSPRAAGLANAVLRRISQELIPQIQEARENCQATVDGQALSAAVSTSVDGNEIHTIAFAGAFPEQLARELLASLRLRDACKLALAQHEAAPVWVAANLARSSEEALQHQLSQHAIAADPGEIEGSYKLVSSAGLASSGLVDEVSLVTCDVAAQAVCHIVDALHADKLLEIGAGRATKSIILNSLARAAGRELELVALDSVASKVALAKERLERGGWSSHVQSICMDARNLPTSEHPLVHEKSFDVVFVDAPCTGTGTMRRHPEIPSRLVLEDIEALMGLQGELLAAASTKVKMGGYLAYSTCSVLTQECEGVLEAFLAGAAGAEFELVSLSRLASKMAERAASFVRKNTQDEIYFRTLPKPHDCDGHFCAVLRRIS